jgi:hypothetical protein
MPSFYVRVSLLQTASRAATSPPESTCAAPHPSRTAPPQSASPEPGTPRPTAGDSTAACESGSPSRSPMLSWPFLNPFDFGSRIVSCTRNAGQRVQAEPHEVRVQHPQIEPDDVVPGQDVRLADQVAQRTEPFSRWSSGLPKHASGPDTEPLIFSDCRSTTTHNRSRRRAPTPGRRSRPPSSLCRSRGRTATLTYPLPARIIELNRQDRFRRKFGQPRLRLELVQLREAGHLLPSRSFQAVASTRTRTSRSHA